MAYQDTIPATPEAHSLPRVRSIGPRDLMDALRKGIDDFNAMPTHVIFISLIYPIAGLLIARATFGYDVVPLLYPLAAGFALLGPFAAVGIYELSRRREQGYDTSWTHAFDLVHADSFRGILALGLILCVIFGVWIAAAHALYVAHFGYGTPQSIEAFVRGILTTSAGHSLIVTGNLVGLLFALGAFVISVVAFPLLVDRNISATAEALYVHPNTVGLRIRRAEDLLGLSLSDVESLTQVKMALMVDDVLAFSTATPPPPGPDRPGSPLRAPGGCDGP